MSRWGERLVRLKILRRKARAEAAEQRRFSKARLFEAELILRDIIDGTDFVTDVVLDRHSFPCAGVALVVTMSVGRFKRLCEIGAELEDSEDSHDREQTEADEGERALGWSAEIEPFDYGHSLEDEYEDGDPAEPSLGSTHMVNQLRWSEGWYEGDLEADRSDDEPEAECNDYGVDAKDDEIIADARARITVAEGRCAMNRAADSRDASPAYADPAVTTAKAFREAQRIYEEAYKAEDECFGRAAKHFPPMPPGIGMGWHLFNDDVIRSRNPMGKDLAKTLERRNEYAKVRDEILARFDHPAMKAATEAAREEMLRLRDILRETKATSPAGALAKLLIFAEISGDLEKAEDPACAEAAPPMLKSAIEDLKTMEGALMTAPSVRAKPASKISIPNAMPGFSADTYGLTIASNKDAPRFVDGDIVVVDPAKAPRPGDCVAVWSLDGQGWALAQTFEAGGSATELFGSLATVHVVVGIYRPELDRS